MKSVRHKKKFIHGEGVNAEGPKLIRKRMRFEINFTQLPNAWLRDQRLSYRACGLRDALMSHDHGWTITLKNLAASSPTEGIDALRGAVRELEEHGYLVRHNVQGRGGKFEGHDWELRDPFDLGAETLFTALDNPTPIRTLNRRYIKSSRGNHTSAHLTRGGRPCKGDLIDERHCEYGCIVTVPGETVDTA